MHQPGQQQEQSPAPTKRTGIRRWRGVIVGLMLAAVAAVLYSLLTQDGPDGTPGTSESPTSSPSPSPGDDKPEAVPITSTFNTWLSDQYADGVGEPWEGEGRVIGTSADRSLVVFDAGDFVVVVRDLMSGEEVHVLEGMECAGGSSIDGKLYCLGEPVIAQDQSTSTPIGALDITTGVFEPLHVVPFEARVLDVIGIKDELIYALVMSDRGALLLALGGEGIVWERPPASSFQDDCRLLGDHIGCLDLDRYSVLDRHTGKMVLSGERPMGASVAWSDGGIVVYQQGDETYTLQLFSGGEEVHEEAPLSLTGDHRGTSVPLEYLFADAVDVDRSGRVVIVSDPDVDERFVATGQPVPPEYTGSSPTLVPSESGVVFLGVERWWSTSGELLNGRGRVIATIPEEVSLVDGIIVGGTQDFSKIRVYPPAS